MTAGRPPLYETPEAMQKDIDAYFAECAANEKPPTVSGLAFALDMSTEALRKYEGKGEFVATVKKAKQRVEIALEERLDAASPVGAIFNLKNNFGWKDKTEVNNTVSISEMTEDQINNRIAQLMADAKPDD
jgi:hypothetical protein